MPVYIRKNVNFTPPSLADAVIDENEDDFIQDPDQVRDLLPQPYRMLDKVVNNLFDRAWDIISNRENERVAEATRIRPPQYECGIHLSDSGDACCMKSSPDGRVIVLGLPNGLAVINAETQQTMCSYTEDKLEITSLHISHCSGHIYLISAIDDMGSGRMFGLVGEHIYLLQTISESDGGSKVIVSKCETSKDGEFLGVCFENTAKQDVWLEVHKLQKDTLIKELETADAKDTRRETPLPEESEVPEGTGEEEDRMSSRSQKSGGAEETLNEEPVPESAPAAASAAAAGEASMQTTELEPESPASRTGSATHAPTRSSSHKFASSTIILKVKPPPTVSGINYATPYQASKGVDATGDVIGTGLNHLISVQHMEQRAAVFEQLHEQQLKYMPKDYAKPTPSPFFHFLSAGRMMPTGLDRSNPTNGPITSLAVWWSSYASLNFYSLVKPAKEVEHKPEVVWPLASPPVISAISPCSSLLALSLQNNNLIVWDKYMGMPRPVQMLPPDGRVCYLQWLEPSLCPQPAPSAPYPLTTSAYLLLGCSNGHMRLVNTGLNSAQHKVIIDSIDRRDELFTKILPIEGIPQLVVSCRENGQVFIEDLMTGAQLCEVTLPQGFSLPTPWDPAIAVGAQGSMMYIKGQLKQAEENTSVEATVTDENDNTTPMPLQGSLFVFTLRSFPSLDKYRQQADKPSIPFAVHTTMEQRMTALLAQRIGQQTSRKERMQERWYQLKDELSLIQQMREEASKRTSISRSVYPQPVH